MAYEVRAFDITDTFKIMPADTPIGDVALLADAIIKTVDPDNWDVLGGPASLRIVQRKVSAQAWFLVIRQESGPFQDIEKILNALKI